MPDSEPRHEIRLKIEAFTIKRDKTPYPSVPINLVSRIVMQTPVIIFNARKKIFLVRIPLKLINFQLVILNGPDLYEFLPVNIIKE